jgi:hypothetical protein
VITFFYQCTAILINIYVGSSNDRSVKKFSVFMVRIFCSWYQSNCVKKAQLLDFRVISIAARVTAISTLSKAGA